MTASVIAQHGGLGRFRMIIATFGIRTVDFVPCSTHGQLRTGLRYRLALPLSDILPLPLGARADMKQDYRTK